MTCTNPELGRLVGSYELGLLSPEERCRFEKHVWECDGCFQDLGEMAPVAESVRQARLAPEGNIELEDERPEPVSRLSPCHRQHRAVSAGPSGWQEPWRPPWLCF